MHPEEQLRELAEICHSKGFREHLQEIGLLPLTANGVEILQLNITRRCNLSCKHCHVASGPARTESASRATMEACLEVARNPNVTTVDVTGGAPEMHPDPPWFIEQGAALEKRLIVRSNLVILLDEGYLHLTDLFARFGVELVGSLPDYRKDRSDRQRGAGTFDRSIEALRMLNARGYGVPGGKLLLDLVHNPAGAYLPGSQESLEHEYRSQLREHFGVEFSRLFCMTNCPIGRYLDYLLRSDNAAQYMQELAKAFNPSAAASVMCRNTLSVGWDGQLYDCDFNQMLDMPVNSGAPDHIADLDLEQLATRRIAVDNHCFACTAGAGSSCQGATAD